MALSPGTRFGPYEIVDEIGAGGMGVRAHELSRDDDDQSDGRQSSRR